MLCLHHHLQDDDEEEVVFSLQRRGEEDEGEGEGEVWPNGNLVEVGFQSFFFDWVEVAFQSLYLDEFSSYRMKIINMGNFNYFHHADK